MRLIKLIIVALLITVTISIYMRYFHLDRSVAYRFKDGTESHCFIVYNDESSEEMKENLNLMYYNVPINEKINVYRTSSDVGKRSIPFGFINVDTDSIIGGYDEFNGNGIYFVKDTILGQNTDNQFGIFSFYLGPKLTDELKKRHFEIYDSIIVEVKP